MTPLQLTANHRYLQRDDGNPFFYLGDTAWELFHRLNREEADRYLKDRARKGFTVIQAVALAELDGLHTPNPYGDLPLRDDDPARPNEAYFAHVDDIVHRANRLGLVMGLLPTWADKVPPRHWGVGPIVFTPENAEAYGRFLGERYRESDLIWILGGDRPAETPETLAIWRAMAAGIRAGDGGRHLMTYHPMGGHSSSAYVHHEDWLDFNMLQSGHHALNNPNYLLVDHDYRLIPAKPTLDGEPRYENHPVNWKPELGWFDDADVRQALYWALLAGGCGVTYGCNDIWQMWQPGRDPMGYARTPWQEALDFPGATQAGYARALYESRAFTQLAPAQASLLAGQGEGAEHVAVAAANDGAFLFAYLPTGNPVTVATGTLAGTAITAHWFDPRIGSWQEIGAGPRKDEVTFTPPTRGRGQDWVLVIDAE